MPSLGVVPPFDEVEHRRAGVERRRAREAVEELALERGKEALAKCVVVAVADRPHRRADARLPAPRPEGERRVLAALIRMMNDRPGLPLLDGHVQSGQHEGRAQMGLHRPADDAATPDVEHHRQVEKPAPCGDVGDVGHPELIRARRREGPAHQIGRRPGVGRTRGRHDELAAADAPQLGGAHQARDALATHPPAPRDQLGMDPRGPVGSARVDVNRLNLRRQRGVLSRPRTRGTSVPRVVPAGGDLQHPAQSGDRRGGPERLHESDDPEGIASVSRANQAAAFFKLSRSSRSRAFSRRRRRRSSRSAVVRPSARRPASRSAWRTQLRLAWADGSNSSPSDSGVRPARTRSTSRRRNSPEYGWPRQNRRPGLVLPFQTARETF